MSRSTASLTSHEPAYSEAAVIDAVNEVLGGAPSDRAIRTVRRAVVSGDIRIDSRNRSISVAGNVSNSVIITGDHNLVVLVPENAAAQLASLIEPHIPPRITERFMAGAPLCPYRGLSYFRRRDSEFLFGRTAEIDELAERCNKQAFTLLLGVSGSGKSSLVRAGLASRIDEGTGDFAVVMRPGREPWKGIAQAVASALPEFYPEAERLSRPGELAAALKQGRLDSIDFARRLLEIRGHGNRLILIVDQAEELFTLANADNSAAAFLKAMLSPLAASGYQPGPFHVVFVLRADFLGKAMQQHELAEAVRLPDVKLREMSRTALEECIVAPAKALGVTFEEGLPSRIVDAVAESHGLPLVEFTLTQLWSLQCDGKITHEMYDSLGGVSGAVTQHAEAVYASLDEKDKEACRRVMLRMVVSGDGIQDTRRAIASDELTAPDWPVADRLIHARLVTYVDSDDRERANIELTHEALISTWPRLRHWIDEDRSFRLWHETIRRSTEKWIAYRRTKAALLRGETAERAASWLPVARDRLAPVEREYIQASVRLSSWTLLQRYFISLIGAVWAVFIFASIGVTLTSHAKEREQSLIGLLAISGIGLYIAYWLERSRDFRPTFAERLRAGIRTLLVLIVGGAAGSAGSLCAGLALGGVDKLVALLSINRTTLGGAAAFELFSRWDPPLLVTGDFVLMGLIYAAITAIAPRLRPLIAIASVLLSLLINAVIMRPQASQTYAWLLAPQIPLFQYAAAAILFYYVGIASQWVVDTVVLSEAGAVSTTGSEKLRLGWPDRRTQSNGGPKIPRIYIPMRPQAWQWITSSVLLLAITIFVINATMKPERSGQARREKYPSGLYFQFLLDGLTGNGRDSSIGEFSSLFSTVYVKTDTNYRYVDRAGHELSMKDLLRSRREPAIGGVVMRAHVGAAPSALQRCSIPNRDITASAIVTTADIVLHVPRRPHDAVTEREDTWIQYTSSSGWFDSSTVWMLVQSKQK